MTPHSRFTTGMGGPVRIQRTRVKGSKMVAPNGLPVVYVGRPSKWGNPYIVEPGGIYDAKRAVEAFKDFEIGRGQFSKRTIIRELRGKNLTCFCPLDQPCHADVLLELANPTTGMGMGG